MFTNAQPCSGSWTFNNPFTIGCISGQGIGVSNPATDPPGCPANPLYTVSQTNTFTFTSPVSTFTIDFYGYNSTPGCAKIEVKINGTFYPLSALNLINFAQNPPGPCTSPAFRMTVTSDGYLTSNSLGALGNGSVGGIYINGVNASSVTISTNDANGTLFSNPYNCTVVPLKLISFIGYSNQCTSQLTWETGIEQNIKNIEVESSNDGVTFYKVAILPPKGSNSFYAFEKSIISDSYFRLKINDLDGYYEYSKTIFLRSTCNKIIYEVRPNPTKGIVEIIGIKNNDQMFLCDMQGRILKKFQFHSNDNRFDFQTLASGIYILNIFNSETLKESLKIVKE